MSQWIPTSTGTCETCKTDDVGLKEYDTGSPSRIWKMCRICATTTIGSSAVYFQIHPEWQTLVAIAQVGNIIMKEIDGFVK